jgi:hypothetical protein
MKNKILQEFSFYDYSEIEISFSIKTKAFDIETLTDFLKLKPTRGWSNGERYIGKILNPETKEIESEERQKPWTLFVYETNGLVDSKRFQDHADHLLSKLDPIKDNLKDLLGQPDRFEILIQVYLKFDSDQDYFGFSSDTKTLKKLADYCQLIEWRNKGQN